MNSKTILTAVIGTIVGLGLAMGTVAFARDTDHMGGGGMMGQSSQQYTHGTMHDQNTPKGKKNAKKGKRGATIRHADAGMFTGNASCHGDTITKGKSKTKNSKSKKRK